MEIKKKTYKVRLYPFTYKRIRVMMKGFEESFDDVIQTLMCIIDEKKLLNLLKAKRRIKQFEQGIFVFEKNIFEDKRGENDD